MTAPPSYTMRAATCSPTPRTSISPHAASLRRAGMAAMLRLLEAETGVRGYPPYGTEHILTGQLGRWTSSCKDRENDNAVPALKGMPELFELTDLAPEVQRKVWRGPFSECSAVGNFGS